MLASHVQLHLNRFNECSNQQNDHESKQVTRIVRMENTGMRKVWRMGEILVLISLATQAKEHRYQRDQVALTYMTLLANKLRQALTDTTPRQLVRFNFRVSAFFFFPHSLLFL